MQGLWKSKSTHFEKDKRNFIKKEIYKNSFNEIKEDKKFEIILQEKYFRKKIFLCKVVFDNKEYNAYSFDLLNFYDEKNYYIIKNKKIKILYIINCFKEESFIEQSIEKNFNNNKYFFKKYLLKKYKYELFFNRFYFYGAYQEFKYENKSFIKQKLKINIDYPFQTKKKGFILYG